MRLTFPGAATSMARLVTLLVLLLWTGARPVRRLDVVLVQAIAERTGVELQELGGDLFHASTALQGPDQPVPLDTVDQTSQAEPIWSKSDRNASLAVGSRWMQRAVNII